MRCPKCSFISFDVLETCVKCGKNISAAADALEGTVASMTPPEFLKLDFEETEADEAALDASEFESEEEFDLGGDDDEVLVDFASDEGSTEESGEMEISADDGADEADESASEEVVAEEAAMDIADLAPTEDVTEQEAEAATDDFEIEADEPEPESAEQAGLGLEDLKVDIDLDESAAAPADKGKVMPSVKTGTALDDFDIDLGDLLPKQ